MKALYENGKYFTELTYDEVLMIEAFKKMRMVVHAKGSHKSKTEAINRIFYGANEVIDKFKENR